MSILENLERVRERIEAASQRVGRMSSEVTLIGVTKTVGVEAVVEAYEAGLRDFGENRVQEALAKMEAVRQLGFEPRWHMIGHLQTNKVKIAAGRFGIIHSVDSVRLANEISRRHESLVPVLLEVNVAQDAAKFGFAPEEVAAALREIAVLPHLDARGLMTIAPQTNNPEETRPTFRRLRALRDDLALGELSMGMSGDFEVAIEEGATMIRVGTAIFGSRSE
ncbi:MAG: YggS family pyridoxal phosphate-dependent enzyme [Chloroflexi bacterium]|nr:YggS family pyridoxal phosphate-dependent enzyme [Chloroflexota bacterium]